MGLSLAGNAVLFGVLGPFFIILAVTIVINVLQTKSPDWLPSILRNWNYLPLWMHSLEPLDKMLRRVGSACCCSARLKSLSTGSTLESIKTSSDTIANSDSNPRQFCDLGQINYSLEVESR